MAQTVKERTLLLDRGFIAGEWVEGDSGATFPVVNPATGEELAQVPRMGADETRRAIGAAGMHIHAGAPPSRRNARGSCAAGPI
jgi:acyl-CoA reductase-like NAD-dependent aldehyde dehydrogenase